MSANSRRTWLWIIAAVVVCLVAGCDKYGSKGGSASLIEDVDLGKTIGSMAQVVAPGSAELEGFGLVGGLRGTGSSECPSGVRAYLMRYILTELPQYRINIQGLLNSHNTAVVHVYGQMSGLSSKNERFDIRVTALDGTQTTSLVGGWLYGAEMKPVGRFLIGTRPVANAGGPVFMDKLEGPPKDARTGYVLAGGRVLDEYLISVALNKRDYEVTSTIRNRLNGRFGYGTAKAVLPGRVQIAVPSRYRNRKEDFIEIVKALYLEETAELIEQRIKSFVRRLAVEPSKYESEMALEAIGNRSLLKLQVLLNSSNEQAQFHAARCMLNLGSDAGFQLLRDIALSVGAANRMEALEAIACSASRNDASAVARKLLRDSSFDIRLAAYEQLRRLDDVSIAIETIGDSFHLERIAYAGTKGIFVSRSGQPRIVLFGSPIYCRENSFIQSADGTIIINAPRGQQYVSVIRKHSSNPSAVMSLNSSFKLGDIVRVLGDKRAKKGQVEPGGLGVPYSEILALLRQMCDRGAVVAEFRAGPPPKIGPIVKK